MKWILLVWLSIQCMDCDRNGVMSVGSTTADGRGARTFKSNEDESGVHLHFWNDLNNRDNFYPNIMQHLMDESSHSDSSATSPEKPNSLHINLNELLPQAQPQVSPQNLLRHAILQTLALGDYRKSDQNLYGTLYNLNADRYKQSPLSWNYHPSAINYIPKAYDTNLNSVPPGPTKPMLPVEPVARATLQNQMRNTNHFVHDYYTNLHKPKPNSLLGSMGYEIGGLPRYSGRLLANEPMPQMYRTFKMFEPVPRQIMMPPPTTRIPEFKPVPPRLKAIPVIDEYLDLRPNTVVPPMTPIQTSPPMILPWALSKPADRSKPSYIYPVQTKQMQLIPFQFGEAITDAPLRKFIPQTELAQVEPSTEAYSPNIAPVRSPKITANSFSPPALAEAAPSQNAYLPIKQNHKPYNVNIQRQPELNDQITMNGYQNGTKLQMFGKKEHANQYIYELMQMNQMGVEPPNFVSLEDSRSTFDTKQQPQPIDNYVDRAKKRVYKKRKIARKPQPLHDKIINDVIKLNVTGFRNSSEDNRVGKTSGPFGNIDTKKESKAKYGDKLYGKVRLHASHEYPIDGGAAESIQFSHAYSRQTTNVPHYESAPAIDDQESIVIKLANDMKNAVLNSLANNTETGLIGNYEGVDDSPKNPFLISLMDNDDRARYGSDDHLIDLDRDKSDTFDGMSLNDNNSSIQRIDHDWTSNRKDFVRVNVNKREDRNHNQNDTNASDVSNMLEHDSSGHGAASAQSELSNANNTSNDDKYLKWFSNYAEQNKKHGRTVISEHFKKVEIEPNISWVILPR